MKYWLKKLLALAATLLAAAFLTFLLFEVIPSNSAVAGLSMDASPEEIEAYKDSLGMNRSLLARYGDFVFHAVTGNFGESLQYRLPVLSLLKDRLSVTFSLALVSFLIIIIFSIPLGILSAKSKKKSVMGVYAFVTQLLMAVPPFFLGMIISVVFGIILRWFTPGAYVPFTEDFFGCLRFLVFPAFAVALPKIGMTVRFMQGEVANQLQADYVRTAKSKGCSRRQVLFHHVLKNSLVPVITFLAMVMAEILAGSIVIEQVFNLSGVGRLLTVSIANRDYPVVRAIVLYTTAVVVFLNFAADILCRVLDPRIREI